jgi:hypothetical protein
MTIRKVGYKLVLQAHPAGVHKYHLLRQVGKVMAYVIGLFLLFVIVVRAIRYEN